MRVGGSEFQVCTASPMPTLSSPSSSVIFTMDALAPCRFRPLSLSPPLSLPRCLCACWHRREGLQPSQRQASPPVGGQTSKWDGVEDPPRRPLSQFLHCFNLALARVNEENGKSLAAPRPPMTHYHRRLDPPSPHYLSSHRPPHR